MLTMQLPSLRFFLRKIQPDFLLFAFFFTFSLESKRNLTWPDSSLSGKKCGFGLIDGHTRLVASLVCVKGFFLSCKHETH